MDKNSIVKDTEIDFSRILNNIWAGRKTIFYSAFVCLFIGILVAVISPVKYQVTATLLPSSEKKGGNLGGLSSLAGLAGINLAGLTDASGIDPKFYPLIVESTPFKRELIRQKFDFEGYSEPISYLDYVSKRQDGFWSLLLKYTIKLPYTLKDALSSKSKNNSESKKHAVDFADISETERETLEEVSDVIYVSVDSKTFVVTVGVELGEATLTAEVGAKVVEMLQRYVINYKTEQVRNKLSFVEKSYQEKRNDLDNAQKALLNYRDQNRNIVSERVNVDYQRLSDTYDLYAVIFKGVAQQYEQVKLQLKEETPVFTVIEPVQYPLYKSSPKYIIIVGISLFFGIIIGLSLVLNLKLALKKLLED